jgi:hypothetical protein
MAHVAIERWRNDLAFYLEPRPGKVAFAFRIALICALTTLAVEIYQTPAAALTIYIVFFLNQKERATSIVLSLALLALLTVLIGLIFLIAIAAWNYAMWRVIAMSLAAFAFLFLASTSKLRAMGGIMALIVGYALDVLALAPVGEAGTRALLYAWLLVGIPAGVSLVVNLAVGIAPRTLAGQFIAWRLSLAAQILRRPDARADRRVVEANRSTPRCALPPSKRPRRSRRLPHFAALLRRAHAFWRPPTSSRDTPPQCCRSRFAMRSPTSSMPRPPCWIVASIRSISTGTSRPRRF